jgi:hypothetical protein
VRFPPTAISQDLSFEYLSRLQMLTRRHERSRLAPHDRWFIMRLNLARLFLPLFLLFYIDCSYAISQERVRLLVSEVQHSASRSDGAWVDSGCQQLHDGFSNFRQAKPRAFCALAVGRDPTREFAPPFSRRPFFPQTISFKPSYRIETVPSRAPTTAE